MMSEPPACTSHVRAGGEAGAGGRMGTADGDTGRDVDGGESVLQCANEYDLGTSSTQPNNRPSSPSAAPEPAGHVQARRREAAAGKPGTTPRWSPVARPVRRMTKLHAMGGPPPAKRPPRGMSKRGSKCAAVTPYRAS